MDLSKVTTQELQNELILRHPFTKILAKLNNTNAENKNIKKEVDN